jgi:hypothetical protein
VDDEDTFNRARTSVTIYHGDLAWLKKKQLSISDRRGERTHMADIVHGLIEAAKNAEAGA